MSCTPGASWSAAQRARSTPIHAIPTRSGSCAPCRDWTSPGVPSSCPSRASRQTCPVCRRGAPSSRAASTLWRAACLRRRRALQLERPTSGSILFEGKDRARASPSELRAVRRKMQVIFQDPYSSLNPRMTVGQIIAEPLAVHGIVPERTAREARVKELLTHAGLLPGMARRYPHELSGGQRQRVGVARALAMEPTLIVCDEPASALDVSIQAQIINLLEELQTSFGLTYLFVAHDLSVVRHLSDRVAVMYLGKIVEITDRQSLYENPQHPYTKALLSAVPIPDPVVEAAREHVVLGGEVPSPLNPPSGCVFHTRCPIAIAECRVTVPELREVRPEHRAACIRVPGYEAAAPSRP